MGSSTNSYDAILSKKREKDDLKMGIYSAGEHEFEVGHRAFHDSLRTEFESVFF